MKKIKTIITFIFLTFICFLSSCSSSSYKTLEDIQEKGTIIVATNAEFAPFEYQDGNEFKGIDIDVIKEYAKYINVKINIKNMDFDASLLSVSTNKADLAIAAITKNAKREETLSFSDSYYTANQVIIVNKDSIYASITDESEILNLLSTNKAKIGCQRGTTGQYYIEGSTDWDFEGIGNTTCVTYDNGALAVTDLSKNNIDAVIIDEAPAKLYCKNFTDVTMLDIVLTQEEYCIAVSKGNESLIASLNEFINKIKNDGTFDEIVSKYYGNDDIAIEDNNKVGESIIKILKGLGVTFIITIFAFILGILIGMLINIVQSSTSKNIFIKILKKIASIYIAIFRGTPVTVQLLIIYYVVFSNIVPLFAAVIAFALNSGAYVSEIIRGGINSVAKGQMEAGRSLGLPHNVVMRKIVLPQAIRNCLPSLGNEFIALIKETSVVSFITVMDLYSAFRAIATESFAYKSVYLIMGVVYFVIIFIISFLLKKIERRLLKDDKAK